MTTTTTETMRIVPVTGKIADDLGAFALYACATEFGLPVLPDKDSRTHGGKLYQPGRDSHGADRGGRRSELREMSRAKRLPAAARRFVTEALDAAALPIMAQPIELATMTAYRRLADGLSDMIEGERLTEADIPDDYAWLADMLAEIAGRDPGSPELPPHMTGGPAYTPTAPRWELFAARDGDTLREAFDATDEEDAQAKARPLIIAAFRLEEYADAEKYDWDFLVGECDGVRLEEA